MSAERGWQCDNIWCDCYSKDRQRLHYGRRRLHSGKRLVDMPEPPPAPLPPLPPPVPTTFERAYVEITKLLRGAEREKVSSDRLAYKVTVAEYEELQRTLAHQMYKTDHIRNLYILGVLVVKGSV